MAILSSCNKLLGSNPYFPLNNELSCYESHAFGGSLQSLFCSITTLYCMELGYPGMVFPCVAAVVRVCMFHSVHTPWCGARVSEDRQHDPTSVYLPLMNWVNLPLVIASDCSMFLEKRCIFTVLLKASELVVVRARFLSLAQSKLSLCSANHRPGYWSNLPCDWPSTASAYSEQDTENGPRCPHGSCVQVFPGKTLTPLQMPWLVSHWPLCGVNMHISRTLFNSFVS